MSSLSFADAVVTNRHPHGSTSHAAVIRDLGGGLHHGPPQHPHHHVVAPIAVKVAGIAASADRAAPTQSSSNWGGPLCAASQVAAHHPPHHHHLGGGPSLGRLPVHPPSSKRSRGGPCEEEVVSTKGVVVGEIPLAQPIVKDDHDHDHDHDDDDRRRRRRGRRGPAPLPAAAVIDVVPADLPVPVHRIISEAWHHYANLAAVVDAPNGLPVSTSNNTPFHSVQVPPMSTPDYAARIAKYAQCSEECFVAAFGYVIRYLRATGLALNLFNIHRLAICSVMIATKCHDDIFYSTSYMASIGGVSVQELVGLELEFLRVLDFDMWIEPAQLRDMFAVLVRGYFAAHPELTRQPATAHRGPISTTTSSYPVDLALLLPGRHESIRDAYERREREALTVAVSSTEWEVDADDDSDLTTDEVASNVCRADAGGENGATTTTTSALSSVSPSSAGENVSPSAATIARHAPSSGTNGVPRPACALPHDTWPAQSPAAADASLTSMSPPSAMSSTDFLFRSAAAPPLSGGGGSSEPNTRRPSSVGMISGVSVAQSQSTTPTNSTGSRCVTVVSAWGSKSQGTGAIVGTTLGVRRHPTAAPSTGGVVAGGPSSSSHGASMPSFSSVGSPTKEHAVGSVIGGGFDREWPSMGEGEVSKLTAATSPMQPTAAADFPQRLTATAGSTEGRRNITAASSHHPTVTSRGGRGTTTAVNNNNPFSQHYCPASAGSFFPTSTRMVETRQAWLDPALPSSDNLCAALPTESSAQALDQSEGADVADGETPIHGDDDAAVSVTSESAAGTPTTDHSGSGFFADPAVSPAATTRRSCKSQFGNASAPPHRPKTAAAAAGPTMAATVAAAVTQHWHWQNQQKAASGTTVVALQGRLEPSTSDVAASDAGRPRVPKHGGGQDRHFTTLFDYMANAATLQPSSRAGKRAIRHGTVGKRTAEVGTTLQ